LEDRVVRGAGKLLALPRGKGANAAAEQQEPHETLSRRQRRA
jgi:hypothetical protein